MLRGQTPLKTQRKSHTTRGHSATDPPELLNLCCAPGCSLLQQGPHVSQTNAHDIMLVGYAELAKESLVLEVAATAIDTIVCRLACQQTGCKQQQLAWQTGLHHQGCWATAHEVVRVMVQCSIHRYLR